MYKVPDESVYQISCFILGVNTTVIILFYLMPLTAKHIHYTKIMFPVILICGPENIITFY